MDYKLKLLATWGLEFVPFKETLYYFIQDKLTKSLVVDANYIRQCDEIAKKHLKNFQKYKGNDQIFLLDFGSGRRLAYPLNMREYCKKVVASDIKKLARKKLIFKLRIY